MSDDPRGKTLWEMFMEWVRGNHPAPRSQGWETALGPQAVPVATPSATSAPPEFNPLNVTPGATIQLSPANGRGYYLPVEVRDIQQVVRRLGGRTFTFVDYLLPNNEQGQPVRLRCLADSGGEHWVLLSRVDAFPAEEGFFEVVNDTTGVFDITDDDTGAVDRFERLNGVQGPYEALRHAGGSNVVRFEYWDWARVLPDERDEFVFVDHLLLTSEIEIWRGRRLIQ